MWTLIQKEGEIFIVAVYVDHIILGGKSESKLMEVKKELSKTFEMKDLGPLHHFLGFKSFKIQLLVASGLASSHILRRFCSGLVCLTQSLLAHLDINLVAGENPDDVCNQQMYQAFVGSLLYLSTKTRPDIAYAVGSLARFCVNPTKEHWTAVKRILQYLNGTTKLGLLYRESTSAKIAGYTAQVM